MIMECLVDHPSVCRLYEAVYSYEAVAYEHRLSERETMQAPKVGSIGNISSGTGSVHGEAGEGAVSPVPPPPAPAGTVSLVMELIEGGDLFDRVSAKKRFGEDEASLIMAEILDVLGYLHSLGVVHRDVKPENICFAAKGTETGLRLIDFGYATVLEMDGERRRELGPRGYCGTARCGSEAEAAPSNPRNP
jgi:serine/threonine protein kinase